MSSAVILPASGYAFRELSEYELELTIPDAPPEVLETQGHLLAGLSRSSNKEGSTTVAFGSLQGNALPQLIGYSRKRPRSSELALTLTQVGRAHWAAELRGDFSRIRLQSGEQQWTEDLPPI